MLKAEVVRTTQRIYATVSLATSAMYYTNSCRPTGLRNLIFLVLGLAIGSTAIEVLALGSGLSESCLEQWASVLKIFSQTTVLIQKFGFTRSLKRGVQLSNC